MGQHRLNIAGKRRHVVQVERDQVFRGQDGNDARDRQGRLLVDRLDAGVAVGAAHEVAEQHAGQFDVIDIMPLALGETRVLDTLAGTAKALKLLGTFAGGWCLDVHSAASLGAFRLAAAA